MADGSSTDYMVVARRYRPQSFTDVVGQNHVETALSNAISSGRIGHAYLFTGARGVGKTSTARILAKALNCVNGPTISPCGECASCKAITAGDDPDVLEIDGASNRGIDEIRALRQGTNIRPTRSPFKVYIIDEVHMLTREAFNALLKTLEEPPGHVKFIFCTTEPTKIPITILSRCQRFDFAGISTEQIAARLKSIIEKEGATAEEDAIDLLARRAAGSMRDGQSLLEQLLAFAPDHITVADVHSVLGTADEDFLLKIISDLSERNAIDVLTAFDSAMTQGRDPAIFLEQLCGYFRDLMVIQSGGTKAQFLYTSPSNDAVLQNAGKKMGIQTVLAALQILDHTLDRMRFTTLGRILAELALTRIAHLGDLDNIAAVIHKIQTLPAQNASQPMQMGAMGQNRNLPPAPGFGNSGNMPGGGMRGAPPMGNNPMGNNGGRQFTIPPAFAGSNAQGMAPPPNQPPQGGGVQRPFVEPNRSLGGGLNAIFSQNNQNRAAAPVTPTHEAPLFSPPAAASAPQPAPVSEFVQNPVPVVRPAVSAPVVETPPTNNPVAPQPIANSAPAIVQENTIPQPSSVQNEQENMPAQQVKEGVAEAMGTFLEGIAFENAANFQSAINIAPNTIEITYAWNYSFGYRFWDSPENFTKLQSALNAKFGKQITIELKLLPNSNPMPTSADRHRAQTQFVRELSRRPIIQEAMRLFKTDVNAAFLEEYPDPDFKPEQKDAGVDSEEAISAIPPDAGLDDDLPD